MTDDVVHEVRIVERDGGSSAASLAGAGVRTLDTESLEVLPARYRRAFWSAVQPSWLFWMPLACVGAVVGGRLVPSLDAPTGWLAGAAAVLGFALLAYLAPTFLLAGARLQRRRIASRIGLGPWLLVKTESIHDDQPRPRWVIARRRIVGEPRVGEIRHLLRNGMGVPAMLAPFDVDRGLSEGLAEPVVAEGVPTLGCPVCNKTGRATFFAILLRGLSALILLGLAGVLGLAASHGYTLYGPSAVALFPALAAAFAIVGLLIVLRPRFRCGGCLGVSRINDRPRPTNASLLVGAFLLGWASLAPLGWVTQADAARQQLPSDAVAMMAAQHDLTPTTSVDDIKARRDDHGAITARAAWLHDQLAAARQALPDRSLAGSPLVEEQLAATIAWLAAVRDAALHPAEGPRWDAVRTSATRLVAAREAWLPQADRIARYAADAPTLGRADASPLDIVMTYAAPIDAFSSSAAADDAR